LINKLKSIILDETWNIQDPVTTLGKFCIQSYAKKQELAEYHPTEAILYL
jgi:hypothetical protein